LLSTGPIREELTIMRKRAVAWPWSSWTSAGGLLTSPSHGQKGRRRPGPAKALEQGQFTSIKTEQRRSTKLRPLRRPTAKLVSLARDEDKGRGRRARFPVVRGTVSTSYSHPPNLAQGRMAARAWGPLWGSNSSERRQGDGDSLPGRPGEYKLPFPGPQKDGSPQRSRTMLKARIRGPRRFVLDHNFVLRYPRAASDNAYSARTERNPRQTEKRAHEFDKSADGWLGAARGRRHRRPPGPWLIHSSAAAVVRRGRPRVTYPSDVLPDSCKEESSSCHRPGEVAPLR